MKVEHIKNEFDLRSYVDELKMLDALLTESEEFHLTNLIYIKLCIDDENLKIRCLTILKFIVDYLEHLSENQEYNTIDRNEDSFKKIYCTIERLKFESNKYYELNEELSSEEIQIIEFIELIFSLTFNIGRYFDFSAKNENHINENELIDTTPLIDFSNSKGTEKIIYLKELGILDFIQKEHPHLSVNGIANLLSAITGENTTTLQPYINPIINSENDQRKNPYTSEKTVSKVKNKLIELNIKKLD